MARTLPAAKAGLLAIVLSACMSPAVDMTDPRVSVGAERTCAELELSEIRCSLLTLRAASELDTARPGHTRVTGRTLHEEGERPTGQEVVPDSLLVAAVVVFALEGGGRVGVPLFCPRNPDGVDRACDPRVQ